MATFGWKAGPEQYPPDDLLEYAVTAEKAGFESIDVSDHLAPWDPTGQACFSWTWLGAAAVRTTSIELNVAYTDDDQATIACMKQYWVGAFLPALYDHRIYTPAESAKNGEVVGSDGIRQKMCLSANPEGHVHYAQQHIDLGFTHLYFHCAGPDHQTFLDKYGRDVLSALREREPGRASGAWTCST
jgi:alkanesulfonate monooxygenase SsuD/methylene tetrahydromethanopterin reductase-like flavin-dependent oxidoreductase (luciferase family)